MVQNAHPPDNSEAGGGNVMELSRMQRPCRPPPLSDHELIEYRRLLPLLRRLEIESPLVAATCPMARRIITGE